MKLILPLLLGMSLLACSSHSEESDIELAITDSLVVQLNNSAAEKLQNYRFRYSTDESTLELAIEKLDQAIELKPEATHLYSLKADILLTLHKYDEAIDELKKILYIDPDYAEVINWIGVIHEVSGNHSEAQKWYQKALTVYKDRIDEGIHGINSYLSVVHLVFLTEGKESALQAFKKLQQEYPENEQIQFSEFFYDDLDRDTFFDELKAK